MSKRSRRTALTEGFMAGILFGTSSIFIRLLDVLSVSSLAFWRLIIASAVLVGITLVLREPFNLRMAKQNVRQISILGIFLGLHMVLYISAVKNTTILNATVLVNTAPVFSMLLSTFHFNIKPSRLAVIGLATSFLGAGLIAYADAFPSPLKIHLIGDLEALLAAVAEAFYLSYGRETRSKMPLLSQVVPIYLISAIIIGLPCLLTRTPITLPRQPNLILFLLGFGILPTALGHTFYYSSLSNLKSFETATLALLEPIGATLLGVALFSEIPTPLFVLGAVLVVSGIVAVALKE
ncbi:MAG: DMT family transporter [Candidatus Bathyarchaeota archaeon]|nr:DMT family transporter [Candidatus Bathyarchaeota archaeon]